LGGGLTERVLWENFVRNIATLDKCAGRLVALGPVQVVGALAALEQESGTPPSRVLEMMDEVERLLLTLRQRLVSGTLEISS
jgi:hypothetical protein